MAWAELPVFNELNRPEDLLPRSRFFHSAVTSENYVPIFGGQTAPYNSSDVLIAYIYECNNWIRLTVDVEITGKLPSSTYAESMTIDPESKAIYVVGGWDGSSQSRVTKLSVPEDICKLWSTKYLCRHYMGCSYCGVKMGNESLSHCFSNGNVGVCGTNGTISYNY